MKRNNRVLFLPPAVVKNKEAPPKLEDFTFNSSIGKGGFARVFQVTHKVSGNKFALKRIEKASVLELGQQVIKEIRIMYSLDHPNIVKLFSHFEDKDYIYLVLELGEKGELYQKIKKLGHLSESSAAQFLREVAVAVQYLHSKVPPIIHRDIKPENIILDAQGRAKLGDFGWSNFFNAERSTFCGTLDYLAPEMIQQTGHGTQLDTWNLGVLLFEMLAGKAPFEALTQKELFEKITQVKIGFPKSFPFLAKDLVKKLLKKDPNSRLTIKEILEHPWLVANPASRPTADLVSQPVPLPECSTAQPQFKGEKSYAISKPLEREKLIFQKLKQKDQTLSKLLDKQNEYVSLLGQRQNSLKEHSVKIQNNIEKLRLKFSKTQRVEKAFTKKRIHLVRIYENEKAKSETLNQQIKQAQKQVRHNTRKLRKLKETAVHNSISVSYLSHFLELYKNLNSFKNTRDQLEFLQKLVQAIKKSESNTKLRNLIQGKLELLNSKLKKPTQIHTKIAKLKGRWELQIVNYKAMQRELFQLKEVSNLRKDILGL
mgnify:FL=1